MEEKSNLINKRAIQANIADFEQHPEVKEVQEKIDFLLSKISLITDKISDLAKERFQHEDSLSLYLELKQNILTNILQNEKGTE
jgi:hypothetical protein